MRFVPRLEARMADTIQYWYSLTWNDEQHRMWAHPPLTFESSSEARKAHSQSLRGYWVSGEMHDAHVSDLYVRNGSRETVIAEGGFTSRPPSDKSLPYKD